MQFNFIIRIEAEILLDFRFTCFLRHIGVSDYSTFINFSVEHLNNLLFTLWVNDILLFGIIFL